MTRGTLITLAVIVATFLNFYPDQTSRAQGTRLSSGTETAIKKISITGKITKEPDGYYIQGQTPPEVFRILNPIPSQLDKIVKSGKSVQIDARIVQGDNVNIERINSKTYYQKVGK